MGAADLLTGGCQKARRVEEAGQPEAHGTAALEPSGELFGTVGHVGKPHADQHLHWHRDRHHLGPRRGHLGVEERIDRVGEDGRHDDGARNSELEIREDVAQRLEHHLHPIDLLLEADVERLAEPAECLDAHLGLLGVVVGRHLGLKVANHVEHNLLAGEAAAAATLLRLDVEDRAERRLGLRGAVSEVGVPVEAEDLRVIHQRQLGDELAIYLDVRVGGRDVVDVVTRNEGEVRRKAPLDEPRLAVCIEEAAVEVVGDFATILHVADHVVDGDPVDRPLLRLHEVQVVLHVGDARREVGLRELVQNVEAEWAKLAALLHDSVHESECEEHRLPLRVGDGVEHVLVEPRVRVLHARHNARGRFVGELDRELQQADGELWVGLSGDP
mmetsp:Transcript_36303/g.72197  ORF Transcript_36303/g.72197 Transcript_36303/m.72197 type:complete len:386 (-) Transcript_36303:1608-2765(-)